jgi:hypothetical protein
VTVGSLVICWLTILDILNYIEKYDGESQIVMQLSLSSFFGFTVSLGGLQLVIVWSHSTYIERCDGWLQAIICSLITLGVLSASKGVTEGLV